MAVQATAPRRAPRPVVVADDDFDDEMEDAVEDFDDEMEVEAPPVTKPPLTRRIPVAGKTVAPVPTKTVAAPPKKASPVAPTKAVAAPVKAAAKPTKTVTATGASTATVEAVDVGVDPTRRDSLPDNFKRALSTQDILDVLDAMRTGETMVFKKADNDKWHVALSSAPIVINQRHTGNRMSGAAFDLEVQTDEYREWKATWSLLKTDEKMAAAQEAGVVWEEVADPRINQMRMTDAYLIHLGIEKYKEEYRDRKSRDAIKK